MNTKKLVSMLTLAGAVITGLTANVEAANASAYVYVDNDQNGAYSDTDVMGTPYFTKYTGDPTYDKYGDYRFSSDGKDHAYYHWPAATNDSNSHVWNLTVWLDNPVFVNSTARYYMDGTWVGTINQKNASQGYNWIGSLNDYGTINVTLDQHDDNSYSSGTGADLIELWY